MRIAQSWFKPAAADSVSSGVVWCGWHHCGWGVITIVVRISLGPRWANAVELAGGVVEPQRSAEPLGLARCPRGAGRIDGGARGRVVRRCPSHGLGAIAAA